MSLARRGGTLQAVHTTPTTSLRVFFLFVISPPALIANPNMSVSIATMDNDDRKHGKQCLDNEEEEDSKIFPQKLMEILSDEDNAEAICWLPHGKAFTIRNRGLFAENTMPKFFPRKAKYSSFTRKLNRWYVLV